MFGATYHVITRGNNRLPIFFEEPDFLLYLNLLKESVKRFEPQVHGYCLMTNHVHLLVQVGSIPIDKIMHNINFRYASSMNKKLTRVRHFFQGHYKAQPVKSWHYLQRLIRYIHLNPVKAFMVSDPSDYRWSSLEFFMLLIQLAIIKMP